MQPYKCRLVIADDNASIRETLRNTLASYDDLEIVGEAADGKEAIAIVETSQPDVVLMDVRMPMMNGVEASSIIKGRWKSVVIVGLCVDRDGHTIDAFMRAGASAVASKDRLEQLHLTIQRAFRQSRPWLFQSRGREPREG